MRQHNRSRMRYIASVAILIALLFSFSSVYADSSIEYDDNGLTPTEQQEGGSGGFDWNPLGWDWSGVGDFFGGLWDGIVDGLSSAWEGTVDFFSNVGDMIADLWNSLPDWVQDLIITIGIVIGVAIAAVLLVVGGVITAVVAAVAIAAAAIAGGIYYALYGGTDAFNWMHATGWIFGSALVAGLGAFAWTSIGWSTIRVGLQSFGGMLWAGLKSLGGAIWTGIRATGRGIAWLAGKTWGGLKWLGGAIWTGIKATGRGIAWLAGKTWGGLKWLAGKTWAGIQAAGRWAWPFIKTYAMAGVWSSVGSIGINLTKYLLGLGDFDPLAWTIDAGIAFGTGLIGGPFAASIKSAFLSGSWGKLVGWVGAAGFVGATGNFLLERFTKGNWSLESFIVGGSAAILASPIPAAFSGLGSGVLGEFIAGLGDFATKTGEEIVKWTYENWLSGFFDFVLVVLSYS